LREPDGWPAARDYGRRIRVVSNTVDASRFAAIVIGGSGSGPEGTGVSDVDIVNNIGTGSPSGYGVQCYENPTNYRIHDNLFFTVQLLSTARSGPTTPSPTRSTSAAATTTC
jgi:hypothetical protein